MLGLLAKGFKFRVNPYFNNQPPPGFQNQTPSRFVTCNPARQYHTGAAVNGITPVTAGAGVNSVVWLPYLAGWVTWTPAEGRPILTGKMSGCWLARGLLNGRPVFLHIGTDDFNQDNNNYVKNAIKIARNTGELRIISAFNPIQHVRAASVFAAQTPDNKFLAIGCASVGNAANDYEVKQLKVVNGTTLPF